MLYRALTIPPYLGARHQAIGRSSLASPLSRYLNTSAQREVVHLPMESDSITTS